MEESLGYKLRAARELAGLTVDDAVYRARIPRAVVNALESEDFGFFTSPLYARSFLKQYGEYVGADVEPWLDSLVPTALIDSDDVESLIQIPSSSSHTHEHNAPVRISNSSGHWAAVWLIAITGALVWGGFEVFQRFDAQLSESPTVSEEAAVLVVAQPPQTSVPAVLSQLQEPRVPIILSDISTVAETALPETPRRAIIIPEQN